MNKISYENVAKTLKDNGYLIEISENEYNGSTSPVLFRDEYGYHYDNYQSVKCGKKPDPFNPHNKYTINNINQFLKNNKLDYECISTEYHGKSDVLKFKCKKCNTEIESSWNNVNRRTHRNGIEIRGRLTCPNCDGFTESQHALILKQIFLHEYSDTIVEEPSCVNPFTNKAMPTDIVNHRLKIAIEIQSEYHDKRKDKDKIKKDFWINKGYKFYALDIREYSILEMCQVFFNIQSIPDYIDFTYGRKLDLKSIQELLDKNIPVLKIAEILNISAHRIYDAIYYNKLHYSSEFHNNSWSPIIQFDLNENYLKEYPSIKMAAVENNILPGNISSSLSDGRNYCCGYYWMYKTDYQNGKEIIKTNKNNIIKNA